MMRKYEGWNEMPPKGESVQFGCSAVSDSLQGRGKGEYGALTGN